MFRPKQILIGALLSILAGCVSIEEINRTNFALEAEWSKQLDRLTENYAIRTYAVPKRVAKKAMKRAFQEIGLVISKTGADKDIVIAWSIGPRPLSNKEWEEVEKHDTQLMKEIITREMGPVMAAMFSLAPELYKMIFAAAIVDTKRGTSVTFTAKMEHMNPIPGTYWPESPPPTAARLGLIKIWTAFEKELVAEGFSKARIEKRETKPDKLKGT